MYPILRGRSRMVHGLDVRGPLRTSADVRIRSQTLADIRGSIADIRGSFADIRGSFAVVRGSFAVVCERPRCLQTIREPPPTIRERPWMIRKRLWTICECPQRSYNIRALIIWCLFA